MCLCCFGLIPFERGRASVDRDGTPKRALTIILHSGAYDRASYALSIALISLASGMKANMMVTFDGLRRFTKGHLEDRTGILPELMASIERGLKTGGITPLTTQLVDAKNSA